MNDVAIKQTGSAKTARNPIKIIHCKSACANPMDKSQAGSSQVIMT